VHGPPERHEHGLREACGKRVAIHSIGFEAEGCRVEDVTGGSGHGEYHSLGFVPHPDGRRSGRHDRICPVWGDRGARKRLDAVGICVVAGLAAFGGGTVRHILLDLAPLFWVQHADWVWALLALCIGAMLFMGARHLEPTDRAMQWPDALGLGLFTALGGQIAIDAGMPSIIAVILGMAHRCVRGRAARRSLQRDSSCVQRPSALCHLLVRWRLGNGAGACGRPALLGALVAAAATTTALRAAAVATDWRLPAWRVGGTASDDVS
jgi:uncharacterized membrane protein YeiH